MRCLPLAPYMSVRSFCVWMVFVLVMMSLFGLHSSMEMVVSGKFVGGGIYLLSLCCGAVNCVFRILYNRYVGVLCRCFGVS